MKTEQEIRDKLKKLGFQKIRKKYGQRHSVIISADKDDMRIWVHIAENEYQTCAVGCKRTFGTIDELFNKGIFQVSSLPPSMVLDLQEGSDE